MSDEELTADEQCEIAEHELDCMEGPATPAAQSDLKEEFKSLLSEHDSNYSEAMFEFCFKHDIVFNQETLNIFLKSGDSTATERLPEAYIDSINADIRFNGLRFFSQLKRKNFEKIYSEDLSLLSLSDDDKKNRMQIIEIFGYDPFMDEKAENKPQLYRDLVGMANEGMRKDVAKQKAAISIVRSYQNIENYQRKVNELTSTGKIDEDTQKQVDSYLKIISTIQSSINQTAEKNNFTTKGIGSNGKGMLSDVMNQIEERGIDEGVTNYYDIATSKSIGEIANISFKAQLNQVALSKTDYADILAEQCKIVKESQALCKKAMEAKRLAMEKITKQELLEELEADYRKKGIKEEDIKEFISREFTLYDGKE